MENRIKPRDAHIKLDFVIPGEDSDEKKGVVVLLQKLWKAIEKLEEWKKKGK